MEFDSVLTPTDDLICIPAEIGMAGIEIGPTESRCGRERKSGVERAAKKMRLRPYSTVTDLAKFRG